jgi:hypothetical protein
VEIGSGWRWVVSSVALEMAGDPIVAIRAVVNPEKVQHVRAPA